MVIYRRYFQHAPFILIVFVVVCVVIPFVLDVRLV